MPIIDTVRSKKRRGRAINVPAWFVKPGYYPWLINIKYSYVGRNVDEDGNFIDYQYEAVLEQEQHYIAGRLQELIDNEER